MIPAQICRQCRWYRWQFAAGIVDTGRKFATGINNTSCLSGKIVVDTGGHLKFATSKVDSGGKLAAGVLDTSGKLPTDALDTRGAPGLANISAKFWKN